MKTGKEQGHEWWLGLADIVTHGVAQGVHKLERVHLSIADETFNVLDRVPVTRPWSQAIRFTHHNLSRLSYRSVAAVATGAGQLLPPPEGRR
ncbi:hypothetical protein ACQUWM_09165 [Marinobacter sp. DUT-3]|uniref:hypothetical protein n=1 Tax=Marinobacter sp. DUT-3 TaxID=3412036 RepID=UPI003D163A3B